MRSFLALPLLLATWSTPAHAQDQAELGKQLLELLLAYPGQFATLKDPANDPALRFRLSGTAGNGLVLASGAKAYVSAPLSTPHSAAEAKATFAAWSTVIDKVDFHGANLVSEACPPDKFDVHCRVWKLDASRGDLDPKYVPFRIVVTVVKVMGTYAASLQIGDV